jgi:O-antigen/teichoic acid export membrane protein
MKRPAGYAILAVVVGIMSLSGVFALFGFPESASQYHLVIPPLFYALIGVQVIVGAVATWYLWLYYRNAPEVFLAWTLIGLVASFYSARVMMPQMLRTLGNMMPAGMSPPPASMSLNQIAFDVILSAAAYWYLVTRRRPRLVTGQPATPAESVDATQTGRD